MVKTLKKKEKLSMMHLRVHDLKEYLYCPRKVFFQYVMPVEKKSELEPLTRLEEAGLEPREARYYRIIDE